MAAKRFSAKLKLVINEVSAIVRARVANNFLFGPNFDATIFWTDLILTQQARAHKLDPNKFLNSKIAAQK